MDWLWGNIVGFVLGGIPTWVWVIVGGVALGAAWRTFGWQGVVGGLLAILTLGAYRQGWRDRGDGKPPIVPDEPIRRPPAAKPKRRKTIFDAFKSLTDDN